MSDGNCIRCAEAPAVTDGLCGHCHWAVKAEIETGLQKIEAYAQRQGEFTSWLYEHGLYGEDA